MTTQKLLEKRFGEIVKWSNRTLELLEKMESDEKNAGKEFHHHTKNRFDGFDVIKWNGINDGTIWWIEDTDKGYVFTANHENELSSIKVLIETRNHEKAYECYRENNL